MQSGNEYKKYIKELEKNLAYVGIKNILINPSIIKLGNLYHFYMVFCEAGDWQIKLKGALQRLLSEPDREGDHDN